MFTLGTNQTFHTLCWRGGHIIQFAPFDCSGDVAGGQDNICLPSASEFLYNKISTEENAALAIVTILSLTPAIVKQEMLTNHMLVFFCLCMHFSAKLGFIGELQLVVRDVIQHELVEVAIEICLVSTWQEHPSANHCRNLSLTRCTRW